MASLHSSWPPRTDQLAKRMRLWFCKGDTSTSWNPSRKKTKNGHSCTNNMKKLFNPKRGVNQELTLEISITNLQDMACTFLGCDFMRPRHCQWRNHISLALLAPAKPSCKVCETLHARLVTQQSTKLLNLDFGLSLLAYFPAAAAATTTTT